MSTSENIWEDEGDGAPTDRVLSSERRRTVLDDGPEEYSALGAGHVLAGCRSPRLILMRSVFALADGSVTF